HVVRVDDGGHAGADHGVGPRIDSNLGCIGHLFDRDDCVHSALSSLTSWDSQYSMRVHLAGPTSRGVSARTAAPARLAPRRPQQPAAANAAGAAGRARARPGAQTAILR